MLNRGLISTVDENEPLTQSKLAALEAGAGLPPSIPPGMRAISLKVNEVVGVAGFVVPGTRVDVMVTLSGKNRDEDSTTRMVLSNAQVLTAGTRYDQEKAKDGAPIPSTVVTLLVTPDDGERVALAAVRGTDHADPSQPARSGPDLHQRRADGGPVRSACTCAVEGTGRAPRPGQAAGASRRGGHRSRRLHRRGHSRRQAIAGDCPMTTVNWQTRRAHAGGLILTLVLAGQCQLPTSAQTAAPAPAPAQARPQYDRVRVTAGRSTVVATDFTVTRIAVTNPEIADAVVVQPREVLIDGKKPGTVSLILWSTDQRKQYDIVVEPSITTLEQQLQALFPGEDISVSVSEEAIVLSGHVSSTNVMLRAAEIATASTSKSKVINMLQVPGGSRASRSCCRCALPRSTAAP